MKAYYDEKNRNSEKYKNAILSVYAIKTETKNYISTLNEIRVKEKEQKLSGVRIRNFDYDSTERF